MKILNRGVTHLFCFKTEGGETYKEATTALHVRDVKVEAMEISRKGTNMKAP